MKKAIMKKWVAALRSGDYKQGVSVLRQVKKGQTQFCCLGVLCNLHAQAHPKIAAKLTDPSKYMGYVGTLPPEVQRWAGMESRTGHLQTPKTISGVRCTTLIQANDMASASFKKIADVIEDQYAGL